MIRTTSIPTAKIEWEGLPLFHTLVEDPFEALVNADIETAHAKANKQNSWPIFMETLSLPAPVLDTGLVAVITDAEEEMGVRWAA